MKLRNPKDFAAPVTVIRKAIGEQECANAVGRSASLVRKWADPDHPAIPNLAQALLLDAAYIANGHGDGPIGKLYGDLLGRSLLQSDAGAADVVPAALMVQAVVGDLSELVRECIRDGALSLSPTQRNEILHIIDRLESETDRLEDAVEASGRRP